LDPAKDFNQSLAEAQRVLGLADGLNRLGRVADAKNFTRQGAEWAAAAVVCDPQSAEAARLLSVSLFNLGHIAESAKAAQRPDIAARRSKIGIVIAVLDRPQGAHGIDQLLHDLHSFSGEVAVVFNDPAVGVALCTHPRIDKWAILSGNAGVARGWNIGINLIEADIAAILNADFRLEPKILDQMALGFVQKPDAGIIGLGGQVIDPQTLEAVAQYLPGQFQSIMPVDKVTGYCFLLHLDRCHQAGITIDPRLSPYFFEELDLMVKCRAAGLGTYAMPVDPAFFSHEGGISTKDRPIALFGQVVDRARVLARNARLVQEKWQKQKAQD
jgi:hypothetical protein